VLRNGVDDHHGRGPCHRRSSRRQRAGAGQSCGGTAEGYGRIVNLSSTSAQGNRGQVNCSAAEAGIQGFTKTLAIELGRFGVTANAVAPGFIATDMTKQAAERMNMFFEDFLTGAAAHIPAGRVGQPRDIAAAIAFLTSEEAGFVSGQVIYVAGGPQDS